jgi:hypothetical protein
MPEHVGVGLDLQAGTPGGRRNDAREAGRGERATALASKDKRRLGLLLSLEPAERPQLVA